MIDPLETVIAFLAANADLRRLINGRVAAKHKYAMAPVAWKPDEGAIVVTPDLSGVADVYLGWQSPRMELLIYAPSPAKAMEVYRALVGVTREQAARQAVPTNAGAALLYYLNLDSAPTVRYDVDLKMDLVQVFVQAAIAEDAIA